MNVLVDGAERLGELSYLIGSTRPEIGDAVEVPFGARIARGVVVGPGVPSLATREIIRVYGQRSGSIEIAVARDIAARNLSEFITVAKRLGPRTKRGNPALIAGEVVVREGASLSDLGWPERASTRNRRIEAVAPGVDLARLAALEAAMMTEDGQILVLCPTKEMVGRVVAEFVSGAARLDGAPKGEEPSAWQGFVSGSVRVGVVTRTGALWHGKEVAGIVVVDEDHPGHREAQMPYTSARDVAAVRAKAADIALVLLSTNPSPAGLGAGVKIIAVGTGPATRIFTRRKRGRYEPGWPKGLEIVVREAQAAGKEVLAVSGTSRSRRRCGECRATWSCEIDNSGSCEHVSEVCERCGNEDTLVTSWDVNKTKRVTGIERVVAPGELRRTGTADLVVLFDVDPWLETAELVEGRGCANRVLEALGKVRPGGEAVIVTTEPDNELLKLLAAGDLVGVAKKTWEQVRAAGLAPFGRQVTLTGTGRAPSTNGWPGRVLGPGPAKNSEWEILVLATGAEFERLGPVLARVRRRGGVRLSVS